MKEFLQALRQELNNKAHRLKTAAAEIRYADWGKLDSLAGAPEILSAIFQECRNIFGFLTARAPKDKQQVYRDITLVAIINAVLAGLPGKMGVGVYVSMTIEAWLAYRIAGHVGAPIDSPKDIVKYLGAVAGVLAGIFWLFKIVLGLFFSLFSVVPWMNPLIFAEVAATNVFGLVCLLGFQNLKKNRGFVPGSIKLARETRKLLKLQYAMLETALKQLSPENLKQIGLRLKDYLLGNVILEQRKLNGEFFTTAAFAYLLANPEQHEKLEGPLGDTFIQAIRSRWSSQFHEETPVSEIAERFREYSPEEMIGAQNTIQGKMFEIMVENAENQDGDAYFAKMHTDESFPGSDIVFYDAEKNEQIEVSLKAYAEDQTGAIEAALAKRPDMPIMTTDEVSRHFEDNPQVFGSGIAHKDLEQQVNEQMQALVGEKITLPEVTGVAAGAGALALYPLLIAYIKGAIPKEYLEEEFKRVLGDTGIRLSIYISCLTVLGPIFAWWLLAKGVFSIASAGGRESPEKEPPKEPPQRRLLEFIPQEPPAW